MLVDEVAHGVDVVVQILAAHVSVNPRAPVAPVPGGAAVVDAQDREAALHQNVMEHVFAVVARPPLRHVLKVARAVHEDDGGAAATKKGGRVGGAAEGGAGPGAGGGDGGGGAGGGGGTPE